MADYGFTSLTKLPLEKVTEHFARRSLIGEQEMVVWVNTKAGCHAAPHKHPNEQIFWILSGKMDCRVENETRTCVAGDVLFVRPNDEHEMWCREDTDFVTMLAPLRPDLLPGVPAPKHIQND